MKRVCKLCIFVLVIEIFSIFPAFSYPTWIDLGSYEIEEYDSWSKYADLPNGVSSATQLWSAINQFCTNSYRSWSQNYTNDSVTETSLMNPANNPNYVRENCDFLFIWPHAHEGNLGNVHGTAPGSVGKILLSTGNVRLGTGYTRWAFNNGCKTGGAISIFSFLD